MLVTELLITYSVILIEVSNLYTIQLVYDYYFLLLTDIFFHFSQKKIRLIDNDIYIYIHF